MRDIILDTNFLMIPIMQKVDIFDEIERICDFPYRLCIHVGTIDELEHIKKTAKSKYKEAASVALLLIKKKNIAVLGEKQKDLYSHFNSSDNKVDDLIIGLCDKDTIVATQDKALKDRLRSKGIGLIFLREKNHLGLMQNVL